MKKLSIIIYSFSLLMLIGCGNNAETTTEGLEKPQDKSNESPSNPGEEVDDEYYCCNNHSPAHCGTIADLETMIEDGCEGLN